MFYYPEVNNFFCWGRASRIMFWEKVFWQVSARIINKYECSVFKHDIRFKVFCFEGHFPGYKKVQR